MQTKVVEFTNPDEKYGKMKVNKYCKDHGIERRKTWLCQLTSQQIFDLTERGCTIKILAAPMDIAVQFISEVEQVQIQVEGENNETVYQVYYKKIFDEILNYMYGLIGRTEES